jgi:hypothetical protein
MPENIEVAVIGTKLEENVFWTVPLVDYFLHEIFAFIELKANWPSVHFAACVALNMQLHPVIVAQNRCGCFR